ncbi:MAG: hypothetical protein IIB00_08060, partial [candidate division Zixibacteria bacterium]|nr:hypothetical protein [candidate division Zixibacteria bacterium]
YFMAQGASLPQALEVWIDSFSVDSSSEEFITGWLEAENAIDLYEKARIPSLSLIPMPVTATWSYRTKETTINGVRIRRHYPQLAESGFHDPDLRDIDSSFLYSFSSMPNWMIPPPLIDTPAVSADSLLEFDKNWLSVRWIQNRFAPPNYKGLLLSVSAWLATRDKHTRHINSASVGYGIYDDLVLLKNVSIELSVTSSWRDDPKTLLALTGGFGVAIPIQKLFKALRFESGIVMDRNFDPTDYGAVFGVGLDTYVYPLKFTNAGITWRIMYKWYRLDSPIRGLNMSAVLQ